MIEQQYLQRVRKIAQHEIGHYIASRHFGFTTGDVTVQVSGLTGGHRGGSTIELHTPLRTITEIDDYLCRRIIILYAGALSEPIFTGAPVKKIGEAELHEAVRIIKDPQSGAHNDHAKIRELRYLLRNIRFPDTPASDEGPVHAELDALDKELWQRAIDVVDKYYMTISGLAGNLTDRLTEHGAEIRVTSAELEKIPAVAEIVPV
ncbi:MAG: hypothetical protein WA793_13345 [Sphingorhabdus sp.]|uniref:hypothetical protein n=1 Tax=Sphingorhabdus sp. TaxID=1902408 RepID=UPI003C8BE2DC